MEVCGIGYVDIDPDDQSAINDYLTDISKDAWSRWKNALLTSDIHAARAIGLSLKGFEKRQSTKQFDPDSLQDLVQLAVGSRDPMAYSIAYQVCARFSDPSTSDTCEPISPAGWAEIDPDNAVPWLMMAGQDEQNGKSSTAALERASNAVRIDSYGSSLYSRGSPLLPQNISPLQSMQLSIMMIGVEAAQAENYLSTINRLCMKNATQDDTRQHACTKLAELLVDHGTTTIDLGVGQALGQQAGWPQDRIEKIKQLQYAMVATLPNTNSLDCRSVNNLNTFFRMRAELGERNTAEFYIEHSGHSVEEMPQEYLDNQKSNKP